jgi:hypothetical protein
LIGSGWKNCREIWGGGYQIFKLLRAPPRKILEMNIKKLMFGFASWSLILFRRASWFS